MAPLAGQLALEGFDVEFATSGRAGIQLARSATYAAILLDHKLPDVPGIEVLKILQSDGVTTPIVVITGYGSIESAVEAIRAGAADFKSKPVRAGELIQTLRWVLASKKPDRLSTGSMSELPRAEPTAPRASRIARVLTELISAPADVHSIEELCRAASLGISPATFRRWCVEEGIGPGEALVFARLLRALALAQKDGTSPSEWMEIDPRTFRSLLKRGGVSELFQEGIPTTSEFIGRQRFVRNLLVLRWVQRGCVGRDHHPAQPRAEPTD